MIIRIDGYAEDIFISGRSYPVKKVREMYRHAMTMTYEMEHFPDLFCRLYRFDRLDEGDLDSDVVMDVDTDLVYRPG
ncbi:hypothetical protein [Alkalicoccobacillus gibsonii]|uniref:hypothetical protein n=1 Tax=Alkalicoccobacillus gibsonii TaxID=79881 RepID=UPI001933BFC8|nr:hypothetical protein [Alkalicoccobacillus gibsonii]MBM0067445.1 hypothetical protein [Alkalicoccobacillus gibsonii]